jgi:hypothetical protein
MKIAQAPRATNRFPASILTMLVKALSKNKKERLAIEAGAM